MKLSLGFSFLVVFMGLFSNLNASPVVSLGPSNGSTQLPILDLSFNSLQLAVPTNPQGTEHAYGAFWAFTSAIGPNPATQFVQLYTAIFDSSTAEWNVAPVEGMEIQFPHAVITTQVVCDNKGNAILAAVFQLNELYYLSTFLYQPGDGAFSPIGSRVNLPLPVSADQFSLCVSPDTDGLSTFAYGYIQGNRTTESAVNVSFTQLSGGPVQWTAIQPFTLSAGANLTINLPALNIAVANTETNIGVAAAFLQDTTTSDGLVASSVQTLISEVVIGQANQWVSSGPQLPVDAPYANGPPRIVINNSPNSTSYLSIATWLTYNAVAQNFYVAGNLYNPFFSLNWQQPVIVGPILIKTISDKYSRPGILLNADSGALETFAFYLNTPTTPNYIYFNPIVLEISQNPSLFPGTLLIDNDQEKIPSNAALYPLNLYPQLAFSNAGAVTLLWQSFIQESEGSSLSQILTNGSDPQVISNCPDCPSASINNYRPEFGINQDNTMYALWLGDFRKAVGLNGEIGYYTSIFGYNSQ